MKKLSPKQRKFVAEYLKDQNGTQAAIRTGYSKKTAGSQAFDLLKIPEIKAAIERSLTKAEERAEITVADILHKIDHLASSDIRKLFNDDGSLKHPKDWPDEIALAVSGIEIDELFQGTGRDREQIGETKKVKLWDKTKALEMLGRYRKMFTDKVEHDFADGVFERLERGRRGADSKLP